MGITLCSFMYEGRVYRMPSIVGDSAVKTSRSCFPCMLDRKRPEINYAID